VVWGAVRARSLAKVVRVSLSVKGNAATWPRVRHRRATLFAISAAAYWPACNAKTTSATRFDVAPDQLVPVEAQLPMPRAFELTEFDRIVTADALFAETAQRAQYRELPVATHEDKRIYAFELKPQSGMKPDRHFHLISVAVRRASGAVDAGPSMFVGPNGAFNSYGLNTSHGLFEISVSEGNLLPNSVEVPVFDLITSAAALAMRYERVRRGN
jgi:hypothetical protein